MSAADKVKVARRDAQGRFKAAVGKVTGSKSTQAHGKADKAGASAEHTAVKAKDGVENGAVKAKDGVKHVAATAKRKAKSAAK